MWCHAQGVDFSRSLQIGRQMMNVSATELQTITGWSAEECLRLKPPSGTFADDLLRVLGAQTVDALDASNYEGANITHDLNEPLSGKIYLEQYSMVLDGGTLEHVFNFPVAIDICKRLVKVDGHFLGISPCNDNAGHGFYQFSPELYEKVFDEASGFKLKKLCWFQYGLGVWNDVKDLATASAGINAARGMVYLLILAQKVRDVESSVPVQGVWREAWKR